MNILIVFSNWVGGWMDYVSHALQYTGQNVISISYHRQKSPLRIFKIHNIIQVRDWLENKSWIFFNEKVKSQLADFKPDLFLTMNESYLLPETIRYFQQNRCTTVCFVADNPFDSSRYSHFPNSLKYFNIILVSDKIWIPGIRNIAPKSQIIKIPSGGGYDKNSFFPLDDIEISDADRIELKCDISFTGESYGLKAEGGYRAGILDQLADYNIKIWGDVGWRQRFAHCNILKTAYQGERLAINKLRELYKLSTINLNMPSPQIFTGFQPRVFEIAACKGFQIVDWREELGELFVEDELVTFKNIPELKDKISYFLKNPQKRLTYIDNLYNKVCEKYTWENRVKEILAIISL